MDISKEWDQKGCKQPWFQRKKPVPWVKNSHKDLENPIIEGGIGNRNVFNS